MNLKRWRALWRGLHGSPDPKLYAELIARYREPHRRGFLERPAIFSTQHLRSRYERQARENLTRSLRSHR